ncbi:hypothetical protein ACVWWO_001965 [Bradyrhizobium sp. F1.13.1]
MILSTHAIVGGAIAYMLPSHPIVVAVAGFASHFVIDAIPHWDYPLQAISVRKNVDNRLLKADRRLWMDLLTIATDASTGFALAILLFYPRAPIWMIALGAAAGMLPDPLQFMHSLYKREPLVTLQRFHVWIHTKRRLNWQIGIVSQAAFAALIAATALVAKQ